jgi:hypothetical protein
MHYGRWYMSTVRLPNGQVLAAGGVTKLVKNTSLFNVRPTETFNPATGRWTQHKADLTINSSLPLYPRLWLMPNGKVFYDGNGQNWGPFGQSPDEAVWTIQRFYNLRTNPWEVAGPAPFGARSGALDAMLTLKPPYRRATVLVAGGATGPSPGSFIAQNGSSLTTVDRRGRVTHRTTSPLNHARWFSQAVTLPDGTVAAFSRADKDEVVIPGTERAVRQVELFNPATRRWTPGPIDRRDRTYHNTAILLPDARVLIGGHSPISNAYGYNHDNPGLANNERDSSFEIYSPPYLFRGPRPRIGRVQRGIRWRQTFTIRTRDGARVRSVVLSSLPATTHVTDNNQRTLRLVQAAAQVRRHAARQGSSQRRRRSTGPLLPVHQRRTAPRPAPRVEVAPWRRAVGRADRSAWSARQPRARDPAVPQQRARAVRLGDSRPEHHHGAARTVSGVPAESARCAAAAGAGSAHAADRAAARPVRLSGRAGATGGRPGPGGALSRPFEEGGARQPRCRRNRARYIVCKPAAVSAVVLTDGRVLYWDGLAGEENARAFVLDGGELMRNSEARVLDLRRTRPRWTRPRPVDGGAVNPEIAAGNSPNNAPRVRANGAPTLNDGDMFCAYQVHLADGRVLVSGGTDWYSEPSLPFPPPRLLG